MNVEFRKLLDDALKSNKINSARKIEIETEYCYIQVYNPSELQKFIRCITKELTR